MYAVLQTSLDEPLSREVLEASVMATQALAKPDVPRLQQDLFGIVAEKLSHDDALGLQAALRGHGVETEVVEETELPSLPPPRRPQSFVMSPEGVSFTDYTGDPQLFAASAFVFAAGGFVKRLINRTQQKLDFVQNSEGDGYSVGLGVVRTPKLKETLEFRIEFFFTQPPFRFQYVLDEGTFLRANGQVLKLRDRDLLNGLLSDLAKILPASLTNLGIKRAADADEFTYPSVHAFEEEFVWSFYQLARGAA